MVFRERACAARVRILAVIPANAGIQNRREYLHPEPTTKNDKIKNKSETPGFRHSPE